jgi:hypothetical protein
MVQTHELLERVHAAKARYHGAIAAERQLFHVRFKGDTAEAMAASFNRWMEQQARVVQALDEYDAAATEYLALWHRGAAQEQRGAANTTGIPLQEPGESVEPHDVDHYQRSNGGSRWNGYGAAVVPHPKEPIIKASQCLKLLYFKSLRVWKAWLRSMPIDPGTEA